MIENLHWGSGGAFALADSCETRLFALVTSLPRRFDNRPGHVLVLLCSEAAGPTFDETMLRQLFGLTPAEARLPLGLAAGHSLAAIGAEHRVTENTLRTQLGGDLVRGETDTGETQGVAGHRQIGVAGVVTK